MSDAHKLPARWRRERDELRRLAGQRQTEARPDAAGRLLARADTWHMAAQELEQELETPPPDVHNAPES